MEYVPLLVQECVRPARSLVLLHLNAQRTQTYDVLALVPYHNVTALIRNARVLGIDPADFRTMQPG